MNEDLTLCCSSAFKVLGSKELKALTLFVGEEIQNCSLCLEPKNFEFTSDYFPKQLFLTGSFGTVMQQLRPSQDIATFLLIFVLLKLNFSFSLGNGDNSFRTGMNHLPLDIAVLIINYLIPKSEKGEISM